jgi:hypothetical protein
VRWQSETYQQWETRCSEWHEWFAWRPVKDRENGYRMWMEKVLRKLSKSPHRLWDFRPITILESDLKSQATIDACIRRGTRK